jgi:tripartite-type tricarboxylate transporter receptor subunit TctC
VADILKKMAAIPRMKEAMAKVGATMVATTPEEYRRKIAQEIEQWSTLLKEIEKGKS